MRSTTTSTIDRIFDRAGLKARHRRDPLAEAGMGAVRSPLSRAMTIFQDTPLVRTLTASPPSCCSVRFSSSMARCGASAWPRSPPGPPAASGNPRPPCSGSIARRAGCSSIPAPALPCFRRAEYCKPRCPRDRAREISSRSKTSGGRFPAAAASARPGRRTCR